jgi:hypothetical protein
LAERREQWDGMNPPGALNGASIAARKRALLVLAEHRQSLQAKLRHHGHVKSRYEDLFLVTLLARLERDWLTQPLAPSHESHGLIAGDERRPYSGVAEWAQPWGVPFLATLQADLYHLEDSVNRLGNWLPPRPRMAAEHRARERLERITAELGEGHERGPAVEARAGEEAGETEGGSAGPSPMRVGAIAATVVATAGVLASLVFVAPNSDNDARHSVGASRGTEAPRPPLTVHAAEAQHARKGSGTRGARHEARSKRGQRTEAGQPGTPATPQEAAQSVPVSEDVSAPAPAPTQVAATAPPPSSEPVTPAPSPAPSQGQGVASKATGGCPPEFGFEC